VGILAGWRSCPRCAAQLVHDEGQVECRACGFVHYAGSAPAVSALVTDESGRLLLARRACEPDAGLWDVLGGFLEEGEEPLAGLARELREEAGIEVEAGALVGVFLDRYGDGPSATSVLSIVWEATISAGEPAPADDVAELAWFGLDELPPDAELAFRWLAPCLREWAARGTRAG
jgi:ADP-ribose pyrophosphatase YjhB (NUDIX family)